MEENQSELEKLFADDPRKKEIDKRIVAKLGSMICKKHNQGVTPVFQKKHLFYTEDLCCAEFKKDVDYEIRTIIKDFLKENKN